MIGESELVCIAAAACGADPEEVLGRCDLGALTRVAAVAETAAKADAGPFEDAAHLVLAILREQPFAAGTNDGAAWLAAAFVLEAAGVRVRARATDVVAFVRSVSVDDELLDVVVGLERLAAVSGRRPAWRCPACKRELYVAERRAGRAVFVGVTAFELTNRCWYEHGAHDRRGEPFPVAEPVSVR